jgi:pyruvate formate lyase activating enzyme
LIARIKSLGYLVKLDTNGTRPQVVKALVEASLVDYVAMDIKNNPARYAETIGMTGADMAPIEESIRILSSGAVDYEFRTTVVDELHSEEGMREMGQWLASLVPGNRVKRLFLQRFVDRDSVLFAGLNPPDEVKTAKFIECLKPFAEHIAVRG